MTGKQKKPDYSHIEIGGFKIGDMVIIPKSKCEGKITGMSFSKDTATASVLFEKEFVSRVFPINVLKLTKIEKRTATTVKKKKPASGKPTRSKK